MNSTWRSRLLVLSGGAHLVCGLLFLFFSDATVGALVVDPPPRSVLLVRGLGGILIAFGVMNLLACRAPDGRALRALMAGTLLFLLFTAGFDLLWATQGLLHTAAWATIAVRGVLAVGYAWALATPMNNT